MNKTKFNFIILAMFITIFTGCTHQPKYSNSVLFSFITPNLRISDAGFIHKYTNQTQIQIYNSGVLVLNLKLAENICINGVCSDYQSFNIKYLRSAHYDEILDNIISKIPIYDGANFQKTNCGFEQNIANKMIKYEVCDDLVKFIDNQNRVKIIIRELK